MSDVLSNNHFRVRNSAKTGDMRNHCKKHGYILITKTIANHLPAKCKVLLTAVCKSLSYFPLEI